MSAAHGEVARALAACAQVTREKARNFHYGLRLLPRGEREALYAVYAWMRVLDDIADEEGLDGAARRAGLDRFGALTEAAFGGTAVPPPAASETEALVMRALAEVRVRHGLAIGDFRAAIEGQRMDLEARGYRAFGETEVYCDRVAGTVGRICLDVWRTREGADAALARALSTRRGIAFQLVNILRDIGEDHARGRCYLPADELEANGISAGDLVAWRDGARCARFMHAQCARAERIFAESAPLESLVSPHAVPTLAAMSEIYRRILRRIARDPRAALARRVRLSPFEKLSVALRARLGLLGPRA